MSRHALSLSQCRRYGSAKRGCTSPFSDTFRAQGQLRTCCFALRQPQSIMNRCQATVHAVPTCGGNDDGFAHSADNVYMLCTNKALLSAPLSGEMMLHFFTVGTSCASLACYIPVLSSCSSPATREVPLLSTIETFASCISTAKGHPAGLERLLPPSALCETVGMW